jgi:hypothetical protein
VTGQNTAVKGTAWPKEKGCWETESLKTGGRNTERQKAYLADVEVQLRDKRLKAYLEKGWRDNRSTKSVA